MNDLVLSVRLSVRSHLFQPEKVVLCCLAVAQRIHVVGKVVVVRKHLAILDMGRRAPFPFRLYGVDVIFFVTERRVVEVDGFFLFRVKPVTKAREALERLFALYGHRKRFLLSDKNDELLAARHAGVDQIPLEHHEMLHRYRQQNDRILAALTLVDCRGVAENKLVQLAEGVDDFPTVEFDG